IGKPGNSPVCTGSDAGSASREWPAIAPPTDPPTSALHPQVIRSCAFACVAQIPHTFNQKSWAKIAAVENSKNAGSTGLSWDLRQKLDYTALDSTDYRAQVIRQLDSMVSADRAYSFQQQFADSWYELNNPDPGATHTSVTFQTALSDFPPNV